MKHCTSFSFQDSTEIRYFYLTHGEANIENVKYPILSDTGSKWENKDLNPADFRVPALLCPPRSQFTVDPSVSHLPFQISNSNNRESRLSYISPANL